MWVVEELGPGAIFHQACTRRAGPRQQARVLTVQGSEQLLALRRERTGTRGCCTQWNRVKGDQLMPAMHITTDQPQEHNVQPTGTCVRLHARYPVLCSSKGQTTKAQSFSQIHAWLGWAGTHPLFSPPGCWLQAPG